MSTFWTRYFGKGEEGLFGKPFRLLSGAPSAKRGQLRPGRLSTAAAKALAANKAQKRLPPADGAPKPGLPAPPSGAPKPGLRLPPPLPAGSRAQGPTAPPARPNPPGQPPPPAGNRAQGPTAPQVTPAGSRAQGPTAPRGRVNPPGQPPPPPGNQVQRRGGLQTFAKPGVQLRGLGDVDLGQGESLPFQANAQAWVTVQKLPLRGRSGADGPGEVVNWPDGTPASGAFWLPKLDLSGVFDPRIPNSWLQGDDPRGQVVVNPRNRMERIDKSQASGAGWRDSPDAYSIFGGRGWDWVKGYSFEQLYGDPNAQPPQLEPPWDKYSRDAIEHVGRSFSDWTGRTAYLQHWFVTFDWSKYPPSSQAPAWLWLNLFDPTGVVWTVQDAEIYRADLQDVASAGEPTTLAGPAWLCLDVMDAMVTGAHGMPVMVRPDGTLDRDVFTAFLQAHPEWVPLFSFGANNAGMLAIVNDLGVISGEVVNVPKPPPVPPPSDKPPLAPVPRGRGGSDPAPPPPPPPPDPRQSDDPGTFNPGGGDNDVNPFGPPPPPEYSPPPYVPPPSGSGNYGPDDDYLAALLDLVLYLLTLEADDLWLALMSLDDDTLAIVVYVLELDTVLAA